jgi:hypothetical protein
MNTTIPGLDLTQLRAFMTDMANITAEKVAVATGQKKATLSMHAAGKRFGKMVVERWLKEGVVKKRRDGEGLMWRINEADLMIAEASEHRIAHLTYNNQ